MITAVDHELRKSLGLTLIEYAVLEYIAIGGLKKYSSTEISEAIGVSSALVTSSINKLADMTPPLLMKYDNEMYVTGTWRDLLLGKEIQVESKIKTLTKEVTDLYNTMFNSSVRPETWEKSVSAIYNKYHKMYNKEVTINQFKAVFEFKQNEWGNDPEMKKYLRLSTLLNANHFIVYLEEARAHYIKIHGSKPTKETKA